MNAHHISTFSAVTQACVPFPPLLSEAITTSGTIKPLNVPFPLISLFLVSSRKFCNIFVSLYPSYHLRSACNPKGRLRPQNTIHLLSTLPARSPELALPPHCYVRPYPLAPHLRLRRPCPKHPTTMPQSHRRQHRNLQRGHHQPHPRRRAVPTMHQSRHGIVYTRYERPHSSRFHRCRSGSHRTT